MAQPYITVSDLTCAVLDADWRSKWLAGKKPSTQKFGPPVSVKTHGQRFHSMVEKLEGWLTSGASLAEAARIDTGAGLLDHVWDTELQTFAETLLGQGKPEEAEVIVKRVRIFCNRLADLRGLKPDFHNWRDIFVFTEKSLSGVCLPVRGTDIQIGGRVDAIRFHPERGLEIVDYKLSQGFNQESDLVQLSIYSRLVPIWRPVAPFRGAIEYYLPEFSELSVSSGLLAGIFEAKVAPVLAEMFGSTPKPAAAPLSELEALSQNTVQAFRGFNLAVEAAGFVEGPQVVRLKLKPGAGVKVASLANRAEDLQVALSLSAPPLIKAGKGFVTVDLPRCEPKPCLLSEAMAGASIGADMSPVTFWLGIGVEGQPIVADLADSNTCHALVAGSTGSGKSEWMKSMVAAMALRTGPDEVEFALIDPKILTFAGVEKSPRLWRPLATALDAAIAILEDAVAEMDARYLTLASEGFTNLAQRRKAGKTDLPYVLLIFDEFADLILSGAAERKAFVDLVARIAGKGRAAGIHLVLATQRPDKNIVTGLIKANLPLKVCLRVANGVNSQIVLDEPGAESLFGRGDLLADFGKGVTRAQGLYTPQAEFLAALGVGA